MNTFLPYQNYSQSATVLDGRRLNKQLSECKQILRTLLGLSNGWDNHPATKMWIGYEHELMRYGLACYSEWKRRFIFGERGGNLHHKCGEWMEVLSCNIEQVDRNTPHWLTDEFCSRHRSVLLAKNYDHYSQFGWSEQPAIMVDGKWDYLWPVK